MPVVPELIVYTKPGCGLCRELIDGLDGVLAARRSSGLAVPAVVERDITSSPAWERAFFDRIPVVDLGNRRLELVTSPAKVRRLLADVLDTDDGRRPMAPGRQGG